MSLADFLFNCALALEYLASQGKGLPVAAIREGIAIYGSQEGYPPTDADLDSATAEACSVLFATGMVHERDGILWLAPKVDESSLN